MGIHAYAYRRIESIGERWFNDDEEGRYVESSQSELSGLEPGGYLFTEPAHTGFLFFAGTGHALELSQKVRSTVGDQRMRSFCGISSGVLLGPARCRELLAECIACRPELVGVFDEEDLSALDNLIEILTAAGEHGCVHFV